MEPKLKKLLFKDAESVKTAMVIFAAAMCALSLLIMLSAALFG